jgi:hypothetical protein
MGTAQRSRWPCASLVGRLRKSRGWIIADGDDRAAPPDNYGDGGPASVSFPVSIVPRLNRSRSAAFPLDHLVV